VTKIYHLVEEALKTKLVSIFPVRTMKNYALRMLYRTGISVLSNSYWSEYTYIFVEINITHRYITLCFNAHIFFNAIAQSYVECSFYFLILHTIASNFE